MSLGLSGFALGIAHASILHIAFDLPVVYTERLAPLAALWSASTAFIMKHQSALAVLAPLQWSPASPALEFLPFQLKLEKKQIRADLRELRTALWSASVFTHKDHQNPSSNEWFSLLGRSKRKRLSLWFLLTASDFDALGHARMVWLLSLWKHRV